jgi:16S rRNA (guanine527-N7)-methyltransferase
MQALKIVDEQVRLMLSFVDEHKLCLPEDFMYKTLEFCSLLLNANESTNLVSKNDSKKLLTRHVSDSLMFAIKRKDSQLKWADIGSGAGFPVIPLCFYFKKMKFFAIESRKKRSEFLEMIKEKLELQNFDVIHGKAETSKLKDMDFVSCRAVGSLEEDFELAKGILKKGGHFLTVKSKRGICEMQEKGNKLLKQASIFDYRLPGEEMEYALVSMAVF